MPRSSVSRYLNLLTGRKSAFSPHGRLVAPIHVKFVTAEEHMGPLRRAKFDANVRGCERGRQNGKNFHFLVKTHPHMGEPFDQFLQLLGAFLHPLVFHI